MQFDIPVGFNFASHVPLAIGNSYTVLQEFVGDLEKQN